MHELWGEHGHDCFISVFYFFASFRIQKADRSSARDNICNFSSFMCTFHANGTSCGRRLYACNSERMLYFRQKAKCGHVFSSISSFLRLNVTWIWCGRAITKMPNDNRVLAINNSFGRADNSWNCWYLNCMRRIARCHCRLQLRIWLQP